MYLANAAYSGLQWVGVIAPEEVNRLTKKLDQVEFERALDARELAEELSLLDLKVAIRADNELYQRIVKVCALEDGISSLGEYFSFEESLEKGSDMALALAPLSEFYKTPNNHSVMWYALASNDAFLSRALIDFDRYGGSLAVVRARFDPFESVDGFPIRSIGWVRGIKDLDGVASKLSARTCALFSKEQILSVDFSKFSAPQLTSMLEGREGLLKEMSSSQKQIFFEKISLAEIGRLIRQHDASMIPEVCIPRIQKRCQEDPQLDACFFSNLSKEQMEFIDFDALTENQIQCMATKTKKGEEDVPS
jgi:hypothetical protein